MEVEQGSESLKCQGNRTRTHFGNNEFILEVIRTDYQIQTQKSEELPYFGDAVGLLKVFFKLSQLATTGIPGLFSFTETCCQAFTKPPQGCSIIFSHSNKAAQHKLKIKLPALINGERVSWK